MFKPDQIKAYISTVDGITISSDGTWEALKEIADAARADTDLAEKIMGTLPGMDSAITAFNGGTSDANNYIIGGMFNANTIAREIVKVHGADKTLDILDFGFGAARLVRHFTRFWPQHRYHAAEVNPATIEHLREVSPQANGVHIAPAAPSPFADNSMDVIYAWSIWTHFDEVQARIWLEDMHRILRPGGCALITVHSDSLVERYGKDPMLVTRLEQRGGNYDAIVKEYKDTGFSYWPAYPPAAKDVGIDIDTFGMAFISKDYIQRKWTDLFEYKGFCIGAPDWQDVVILVKK